MKRGMLFTLAATFFKIGLITFGGGYAMIAIIEDICVEQKGWITHDEMMNLTVVAESTPGPVAINCATYVGCRMAGVPGALAATVGVVLPSFGIILAISQFLEHFLEIRLVASAFRGIQVAVGLLVLTAAFNIIRQMEKRPLAVGILACAFAVMLLSGLLGLGVSSVSLLLAAAAVSLALPALQRARGKKGGEGK